MLQLCVHANISIYDVIQNSVRIHIASSGVGDLLKHLRQFGYRVTYQQRALDEYQYGVSNLKVDLRDGVRLV